MAETNTNINMYPNLSPAMSDNQQFRLNKINVIRDYLLPWLKKENSWVKDSVNIFLLLIILRNH